MENMFVSLTLKSVLRLTNWPAGTAAPLWRPDVSASAQIIFCWQQISHQTAQMLYILWPFLLGDSETVSLQGWEMMKKTNGGGIFRCCFFLPMAALERCSTQLETKAQMLLCLGPCISAQSPPSHLLLSASERRRAAFTLLISPGFNHESISKCGLIDYRFNCSIMLCLGGASAAGSPSHSSIRHT